MCNIKPSSKLYLTLVNDYVTTECFADHHGLTDAQAKSLYARSGVIWHSESSKHREHSA